MLGLILFLLAHGSLTYGWRGVLGFFACAYPVAFAFEALAIATGFPFGYFTHDSPGLEVLGVPPTVPIVYGVAGYVAWSIARLVIVGDRAGRLTGPARFVVPPVAAVVLGMFRMGIPALMALACVLVRRDAADEPSAERHRALPGRADENAGPGTS